MMEERRIFQSNDDDSWSCAYWPVEGKGGKLEFDYFGLDSSVKCSNPSIVAVGKGTSKVMMDDPQHRRPGPSGGGFQPHPMERNHMNPAMVGKEGTALHRQWFQNTGSSPTPDIYWTSLKTGETNSWHPYNDIRGYAMCSKDVRRRLMEGSDPEAGVDDAHHWCEQAIKMQLSRFYFQMLVCYYKVPKQKGLPTRLHNDEPEKVWLHFNQTITAFAKDKVHKVREWKLAHPWMSDWQIFLLKLCWESSRVLVAWRQWYLWLVAVGPKWGCM
jgi:hypothetical protein